MTHRPFNSFRAGLVASRVVLLAILLAHGGSALATTFTVGAGAGCTHGTIQSAINAANANPGFDAVRLTRSLTYQPEANTINATNDLNLVGGFATCTQAATDNIKTVVSGVGGAAEPVFRISVATGVIVKLRHLTISGGDEEGSGRGGGINFQGDGVLEIIESTITNNSAATGGGIYALGTGSNAELIISEGTLISNNTARFDGGGISIGGPIEMTMIAPDSIIAFNDALGQATDTGYGGGLQVSGQAIAYIGTSGFGGLGAIYSNTAIDGGGISIISGGSVGSHSTVHLFTTDPAQPVTVRGNYASDTGGAVYLQSQEIANSFEDSVARLCAWDFRIEDNAARDGSALYLNSDNILINYTGSEVQLNYHGCTQPGAVRCASGVACNTIWNNDAVNSDGSPSSGATLRLLQDSILWGYRFDMRGNRGGDGIRGDEPLVSRIEDCLVANNIFTRQLFRNEGGLSYFTILGCTIAGNVIGSTDVMYTSAALVMAETIIDQPGNLTLAHGGGNLTVANVLASDITTLPSSPNIISGDPSFVDAANGNYRLQHYSMAVDFSEPAVGDDRDLDNLPRDQDLPGVSNLFGVRDLGAYERQISAGGCGAADTIFCNGFEP